MKSIIFKERKILKDIFLTVGIITGFIFIVAFSSLYVSDAIKNNNACGCVIPIPWMILILSSLGIFVGSIAYYTIASKYIKEKKAINKDINYTLNFLDNNEKQVIKSLIENKEGISQSQIEKATGLHKVKVHRIINKLLQKDIIEKHSNGKTNKIVLKQELKEIFT